MRLALHDPSRWSDALDVHVRLAGGVLRAPRAYAPTPGRSSRSRRQPPSRVEPPSRSSRLTFPASASPTCRFGDVVVPATRADAMFSASTPFTAYDATTSELEDTSRAKPSSPTIVLCVAPPGGAGFTTVDISLETFEGGSFDVPSRRAAVEFSYETTARVSSASPSDDERRRDPGSFDGRALHPLAAIVRLRRRASFRRRVSFHRRVRQRRARRVRVVRARGRFGGCEVGARRRRRDVDARRRDGHGRRPRRASRDPTGACGGHRRRRLRRERIFVPRGRVRRVRVRRDGSRPGASSGDERRRVRSPATTLGRKSVTVGARGAAQDRATNAASASVFAAPTVASTFPARGVVAGGSAARRGRRRFGIGGDSILDGVDASCAFGERSVPVTYAGIDESDVFSAEETSAEQSGPGGVSSGVALGWSVGYCDAPGSAAGFVSLGRSRRDGRRSFGAHFTYVARATIFAVQPSTVTDRLGAIVRVVGEHLPENLGPAETGMISCAFGSAEASAEAIFVSTAMVACEAPAPLTVGLAQVQLVTEHGEHWTEDDAPSIEAVPAARAVSVEPADGWEEGGALVDVSVGTLPLGRSDGASFPPFACQFGTIAPVASRARGVDVRALRRARRETRRATRRRRTRTRRARRIDGWRTDVHPPPHAGSDGRFSDVGARRGWRLFHLLWIRHAVREPAGVLGGRGGRGGVDVVRVVHSMRLRPGERRARRRFR